MNDFVPIEEVASALLRNTGPAARRQLLRTLARDVRKSQSDRIARQQQPDASPFEPRKARPKKKKGKRRLRERRMFAKLRLARHLKAGSTADEAWIGFAGRASRIARVHQDGGLDAPAPGMRKLRYARRVLLGLSEVERQRALDLLLDRIVND